MGLTLSPKPSLMLQVEARDRYSVDSGWNTRCLCLATAFLHSLHGSLSHRERHEPRMGVKFPPVKDRYR